MVAASKQSMALCAFRDLVEDTDPFSILWGLHSSREWSAGPEELEPESSAVKETGTHCIVHLPLGRKVQMHASHHHAWQG